MNNYRYERISLTNLSNLVYLYQHCFNLRITLKYLTQKYNTGNFGSSFIGFLAIDSLTSLPAGYYGVFPILCVKDGKKILAAQSGDTMTHPDHQGKGLFTKLALMTYELAKVEGVSFVFGFPNSNSYPGFIKKLSWKHYEDINNYSLKTGSLPFDKIAKKVPLFGYFYTRFIAAKLAKYVSNEMLDNSLKEQLNGFGHVLHDKNFYEYKTYNTIYKIKYAGINCIVKVDGRFWVGDIDFVNAKQLDEMVGSIMKLAKKVGCSSVQFSVFNNSHLDNYLKNKYSIKSKNPVGYINLLNEVNPDEFAYQAIDFDTF